MLFADVVRSMELAATLDPERLRDIMSAVFNRSALVVQRYGGTVDKFTGTTASWLCSARLSRWRTTLFAALSGAPLTFNTRSAALAGEAHGRDGIDLRLRIGLNSGQVIAGDIDRAQGVTPPSGSRWGRRSVWKRPHRQAG